MFYDIFGDPITHTKTCIYCKTEKPITDFPNRLDNYDRYDSKCKRCKSARERLVRTLRKTAPEGTGFCEICGEKPKVDNGRKKFSLVLDHCIEKNSFRGWLCTDCNRGLGLFGDSVAGLKKAIDYLEKNRD